MGNFFISILITIFFLRKSSKEVDDKTKNASWARTCIYLILTIIFGVFYYQTFQVATIVNKVEINTLRGFVDSLKQSTDTIEYLHIYNNFKTLGSYKNPYYLFHLFSLRNYGRNCRFFTRPWLFNNACHSIFTRCLRFQTNMARYSVPVR